MVSDRPIQHHGNAILVAEPLQILGQKLELIFYDERVAAIIEGGDVQVVIITGKPETDASLILRYLSDLATSHSGAIILDALLFVTEGHAPGGDPVRLFPGGHDGVGVTPDGHELVLGTGDYKVRADHVKHSDVSISGVAAGVVTVPAYPVQDA